jgi:L-ascorbate metabolism protein UlaG (beta-lactamase superfamily)
VTRITYVGHATVLIEDGETRVLTDPLLRNRVAHLRRIAPFGQLPRLEDVDAVLISHAHHDHLDLASMRRFVPSVPVVVPRGWAGLLRRAGFEDAREVDAGDCTRIGAVELIATPAEHDGRRWPLVGPTQAVGYVIQGQHRTYFAGDTDLFDGMAELAGNLDVALLPVAGWGTRLPPGHLNPESAARAAALLRPSVAVPVHWGTYASPRAAVGDAEAPAREFAELAASLAPEVGVRILRPGEAMQVPT